ncbi:MAG: hypothetical protein ABL989_16820 [Gammaproteobacteria bacterium]
MSDDTNDRPLIRNEDTLRRRAWIDLALASVRNRLKPAELGEGPVASEAPDAPEAPPEPAADAGRPKLYLVRNSD